MVRGIRTAIAVLGVAAGLLAAPADAAPGFVLTADRSGWVDVVLDGPRTYDLRGVTVETRGRYGGFFAEQLTSTTDEAAVGRFAGHLALRDLMADGTLSDPEPVGYPQLTSGVVRFYVLADGPTTVRITDPRLPGRTIRPRHPVTPRLQAVPLRATGAAWGAEAPFTSPRPSFTVVGLVAEGEQTKVVSPRSCIAAPGDACSSSALGMLAPLSARNARRDATTLDGRAHYWLGGMYRLPAGTHAARFGVDALPPLTRVDRARGIRFTVTRA